MSFTSGNYMPIYASKEEEQSRKVSLDPNSPIFQPAGIVTEIAEGMERTCDCDKPSNALMVDDNTSDAFSLGPFTEDSVKMLNLDSHSHSDSCSFDFSFKNSSSVCRSSADQGHSPNPFERNCPDMLNDVTMNSEDSLDKSTGSYSSPDKDFEDTLDKNMCFTAEKEHSNVVNKVQIDKVSSEHSQTTEEKNPMNFLSLPEELFTPDYDSPEVTDVVSGMDFFYKVSTFDVCCDNDQFVGNSQPYQINQNWFRSYESHQAEITWSSIRAKRPNHFESSKPKLPPAENSKPHELLSVNSKPTWAPNENSLTKWFPTEHSKPKQLPPENTKPKWSPAEHSKKKCHPFESSEPKRKNSEPKSSQLSTEVQKKPTLKLFQSLGEGEIQIPVIQGTSSNQLRYADPQSYNYYYDYNMYQAGMHLQSENVQNVYYTTAFPAQAAMQLPQQPSSLQLQPFYSPIPGSGRGFYQITGNTNQQNLPAYPSAYTIPSSTHVYYNQTYTPNNVTYPIQGTQYMENVHQGWYQTSGDSNTCGLDGEEPQVPLGNPLTDTQEAHASSAVNKK
ncbi:UNVERIFIED_CONTAM: hypothetical protein FKN15_067650 [Acipenser sinensis]